MNERLMYRNVSVSNNLKNKKEENNRSPEGLRDGDGVLEIKQSIIHIISEVKWVFKT